MAHDPGDGYWLDGGAEQIVVNPADLQREHLGPRTGWWFTPAKTNSRRYFQAGQILPDLHADGGLTIWQWDGRQDD